MTRPNRRQTDYVRPILTLAAFLALAGVVAWADYEPNDGTDTGVGCVDDCLEPLDLDEKRIDAEPIRHDHEEA